jgi:hypothetical protein
MLHFYCYATLLYSKNNTHIVKNCVYSCQNLPVSANTGILKDVITDRSSCYFFETNNVKSIGYLPDSLP